MAWKDGSINVHGGYYSKSIMIQGTGSDFYYNSLGITQQLLDKKLSISLSASSPFQKYYSGTTITDDETFYSK